MQLAGESRPLADRWLRGRGNSVGHEQVDYRLEHRHFQKREYDEAKKWFEKSAKQGCEPSGAFLLRIKGMEKKAADK
jgi:pentatricopeptide repeat protein